MIILKKYNKINKFRVIINIIISVLFLLSAFNLYSIKNFAKAIIQSNFKSVPLNEVIPADWIYLEKYELEENQKHPIFLFENSEIDIIRNKIRYEPYKSWFNKLEQDLKLNGLAINLNFASEKEKSYYAKLSAFCYSLKNNRKYLENAKILLLNISEPNQNSSFEGGSYNSDWGDWMEMANSITKYSISFDLVYNKLTDDEQNSINEKIAKISENLNKNLHLVPNNNHAIIIACGLAISSAVINHPQKQIWFENAFEELSCSLSQIQKDGTFKEGAYYANFTSNYLFPFFAYYYKLSGINLFQNPRIKKFTQWLIDLEKDNNSFPLFDDAFNNRYFYKAIAVGLSPYSANLKYLSEKNEFNDKTDNYVESIAFYNNLIKSEKPNYLPLKLYYEGGNSIFRSNEIFGLFLHENPENNSDHDHPDLFNFLLSAFGEDFLIDPGYGKSGVNNENREYYLSAENHNIPLVNGFGPNINPVFGDNIEPKLIKFFSNKNLSLSAVKGNYRDSNLERDLYFVNKRYFVIIDKANSTEKQFFSYNWNGNGEISINKNNIKWKQKESTLDAYFLSSSENHFIRSKPGKNTYHNLNHINNRIEVRFPPQKKSNLISIFIPKNNEDIKTENFFIETEGNYSARKIIQKNSTEKIITSEKKWETGDYKSDANNAIISTKNSLKNISLTEATFFKINEEYIFQSESPVDITIFFKDVGIEGEIYSKTKNEIQIFSKNIKINDEKIKNSLIKMKSDENIIFNSMNSKSAIFRNDPTLDNFPILNKLNNFDNLEVEDLNEKEKIQLRNEIYSIIGEEFFEKNFLGKRLKEIFQIVSGLIKKSYVSGSFDNIKIPQKFEINKTIFNNSIKYKEEGFFKKKSLDLQFQQLIINDKYFLSNQKLFDSKSTTSFEIFTKEINFFSDYTDEDNQTLYINKFQKDRAYRFQFQKYNSDLNYSCRINYKNWSSSILTKFREEKLATYTITEKYSAKKRFLEFCFNDDLDNKDFSLNTAQKIGDNIRISNYLVHKEKLSSHSKFYFRKSFLSGELSTFNSKSTNKNSLSLNYSLKDYFFHTNLNNFKENELKITSIKDFYNWSFKTSNSLKYYFFGEYYISNKIVISHNLDSKNNFGSGISYLSQNQYSINFQKIKADKLNFTINTFSNIALKKSKFIVINLNQKFQKNFKLKTYDYKININQNQISPGISIKKDNLGIKTFEGYLIYEF